MRCRAFENNTNEGDKIVFLVAAADASIIDKTDDNNIVNVFERLRKRRNYSQIERS